MKIKLFFYCSILLISGLTYLILQSSFLVLKILSLGIPLLSLAYFLVKLSIKPVNRVVLIFFNKQIKDYNKYVEKPRLLVYIIFVPILVFVIYHMQTIGSSEGYYTQLFKFIVYNLASFMCLCFLQFSWSKYFIEGVTNEKPKIESKNNNEEEFCDFKLSYTKTELKQIYQKMIDNSFIESLVENQQMNDDDYFVDILYNGKLPEQTIFKLNFDNIQTKTFWDYLQSRDIGAKREFKLSLDKFAKIFQNNNGEIKVKSVSSSTSKASSDAKKSNIINSLFDFEKKVN